MRICERALNWLQIINYRGDVRLCSWLKDGIIGSLSDSSLDEIWHSQKANEIRRKMAKGDYSICSLDACPYLSMGTIDDHLVDVEAVPEHPQALLLAYEQVCNYKCTCCSSHTPELSLPVQKAERGYRNIYEKIRPYLPYLKVIGANGRGELFCSKYTMALLAEWKPVAPADEVHAWLETNGSLFDAAHWKKIENLGQYNLSVAITVMSFDEYIYQTLSGTKLPISKIESNLKFVKNLREQNIVNYFEIAAVVQERNFHTMPDFARRCVEEFGADSVRLRPYQIQGSGNPDLDWFKDVRSVRHPYHKELLEIMKDPIFSHPKVHDWGGGRDSMTEDLPSKIQNGKYRKKIRVLECMLEGSWEARLDELLPHETVVYGLGAIGKRLANVLSSKGKLKYSLDRHPESELFAGAPVLRPEQPDMAMRCVDIVVTPTMNEQGIMQYLRNNGYTGNLLDICDVVGAKE